MAVTLGAPTAWIVAVAQAPASPGRGLLLVAGWVVLARVVERHRSGARA